MTKKAKLAWWTYRNLQCRATVGRLCCKRYGFVCIIITQTIIVAVWQNSRMLSALSITGMPIRLFCWTGCFHAGCLCCSYYHDGAKSSEWHRDRAQAQADYQTNIDPPEIEAPQKHLSLIETEKLDKIIMDAGRNRKKQIILFKIFRKPKSTLLQKQQRHKWQNIFSLYWWSFLRPIFLRGTNGQRLFYERREERPGRRPCRCTQ